MKANAKSKADSKADAGSAANPKKTLLGIIIGAVLLLVMGGGAAWYLLGSDEDPTDKKTAQAQTPPEYIQLERFVVNLQPEEGAQYLQVGLTLQVAGTEQAEIIKANMAMVRNRILLLLSSKLASELGTLEGKQQLANEITASLKKPFTDKGEPQQVTGVLYTEFIIQ